jgi:hypothetical protein
VLNELHLIFLDLYVEVNFVNGEDLHTELDEEREIRFNIENVTQLSCTRWFKYDRD